MYVWNGAEPWRDGDLEAGIVIHGERNTWIENVFPEQKLMELLYFHRILPWSQYSFDWWTREQWMSWLGRIWRYG
jgi:hypothetical protein